MPTHRFSYWNALMLHANTDGSREASPFRGRELQVPYDLEAERLVLAGIVAMPEMLDLCSTIVAPRDFFRDSHQIVYRAVLEAHAAGQPIDALLIFDAIRRKPEASTIDETELLEIFTTSQGCVFADHYARIVRDASLRRDLILEAAQTTRDAYAGVLPADEQVVAAEARFFAIGQAGKGRRGISLREAIERANTRIEDRRGGTVSGVPTGFKDLDRQLGGCLANSQLILVAARPGVGKTSLALNICEHVGELGAETLFVSMEMASDELGERMLSGRAGVPNGKLKKPSLLSRAEIDNLERASIALSAFPIQVNDCPDWMVSQIMSEARRQKSARDIKLIVLDYIQLIGRESDMARSSRQEQVAHASRQLKILAKHLDVPVLALCQLNREAEKRADHRPMLSDLRESGGLEQDADVVLLLHRPDMYEEGGGSIVAEINVAKNRNGPTGTVRVGFQKELTRFRNLAPHEQASIPKDDGVNF